MCPLAEHAIGAKERVAPARGFGDLGLGSEVWGVRFGGWVRGLRFDVWGLRFGFWGLVFLGLGFGVWGLGFGVWGLGCGVWGLGFEALGSGLGV